MIKYHNDLRNIENPIIVNQSIVYMGQNQSSNFVVRLQETGTGIHAGTDLTIWTLIFERYAIYNV